MSTNAAIGIRNEKGKIRYIYNHWDGYPEYLGVLLVSHYTAESKVKKLISMGGISALKERLEPFKGEIHTFDKSLPYVTIAYHRDRGEEKVISNAEDISYVNIGEYAYIYDLKTKSWETYKRYGSLGSKGEKTNWVRIHPNYERGIKEWILGDYYSILPRGYDKVTGEKLR